MRRVWPAILLCTAAACKDPEPEPEPEPPATPCTQNTLQLSSAELTAVAQDGCGRVIFDDLAIVADGAFELELFTDRARVVPTLRALEDGSTFRALHFSGFVELDGAGPVRWWRQGFGSSSPSGVYEPGVVAVDDDGVPVLSIDDEQRSASWWAGAVGRPGGPVALVGGLGARVTTVSVAYDADRTIHAVWGGRGEAIDADEGDRIYLDPLFVGLGPDATALWTTWAETVAEELAVELPASTPPVGWSTGDAHPGALTEQAVRDGLSVVDGWSVDSTGVELVRVGEGWARARGDWVAGDGFPGGMAPLAADIAAGGRVPGLWLAPLHVDRSTATYADHPDWWVRDATGAELDDDGFAILDVTHPDAATWLSDEVARLVDQGWRSLDVDHLSVGAVSGQRFEPVTGVEAWAVAAALIRDAAGDGTWLHASDAPMLPGVGWADSYRIAPPVVSAARPDPDPAALAGQLRASAARGFADGVLWWTETGPLTLRGEVGAEAASLARATQIVSGGPWMIGDPPAAVDPDLALDPALTVLRGTRALPADPLGFAGEAVPATWTLEAGGTVLVNPSDDPVDLAGPGGTELLSGATAEAGERRLAPRSGEVWR